MEDLGARSLLSRRLEARLIMCPRDIAAARRVRFERTAAKESARKAFGENLKRLRQVQGLRQEELAERSGIIRRTLIRFERGRSDPSVLHIWMLCRALGTSPDHLLLDGRFQA